MSSTSCTCQAHSGCAARTKAKQGIGHRGADTHAVGFAWNFCSLHGPLGMWAMGWAPAMQFRPLRVGRQWHSRGRSRGRCLPSQDGVPSRCEGQGPEEAVAPAKKGPPSLPPPNLGGQPQAREWGGIKVQAAAACPAREQVWRGAEGSGSLGRAPPIPEQPLCSGRAGSCTPCGGLWGRAPSPPPRAPPLPRSDLSAQPSLKVPHSPLARHPCPGRVQHSQGSQPALGEPALGGPALPDALGGSSGRLGLWVSGGSGLLGAVRPTDDAALLPRPPVLPGGPGAWPEHQPRV